MSARPPWVRTRDGLPLAAQQWSGRGRHFSHLDARPPFVVTMARLNGKMATVTGSASRIGEATVRQFVSEGAVCHRHPRAVSLPTGSRARRHCRAPGGLHDSGHASNERAV